MLSKLLLRPNKIMGVCIELCNINLNKAIVKGLSSNFIFNWGVYYSHSEKGIVYEY